MIYPNFISKNKIIGVTAPSDGVTKKEKVFRLENAIKKFNELGYKVITTDNVKNTELGRSAKAEIRAKYVNELYKNNEVDLIICACGGDFLLEILPYINEKTIKENIKWIQGYSDPTGLLYYITTKLDIATIYSDNFTTFGMKNWHKSLVENLNILEGNLVLQNSYDKYESTHTEYIIGDEEYNLDAEVKWKNLKDEEDINISGRIIGGCLDVLDSMIGTKYDGGKEFIEKYKKDGIIWYFDNCELTSEQVIRALWKFKVLGYFENVNGIIFGRSMTHRSYYDISFKDAIIQSIGELNIPIIYDTDIGHIAPQMTIINGAVANVISKDGKGRISFELK